MTPRDEGYWEIKGPRNQALVLLGKNSVLDTHSERLKFKPSRVTCMSDCFLSELQTVSLVMMNLITI